MALVAGKLLGLNEEQMANALAVAGCFTIELGVLDAGKEELTMARNLRFPYGAYSGILGALLAGKGFKGPLNVFEGEHGFIEVVAKNKINLERLVERRKDWSILYTWIKSLSANGHLQGLLEATLTLVKKHNIRPEDIAEIKIRHGSVVHEHMTDSTTHKYPKTMETASHSVYYLTAIAVLDRAVGPDQYSDEKVKDPRVRELIDKVVLVLEPELDQRSPSGGAAEITIKGGEKYSLRVERPKGHPMNPMTDADVEEKFRSMAGKFMNEKQMSKVITTIYNLEKLKDIRELVKLLVAPGLT